MFQIKIFFASAILIAGLAANAQNSEMQSKWKDAFEYFPEPSEFIKNTFPNENSIARHARIFNSDKYPTLFCKFPARYKLLADNELVPAKDFKLCVDLQEFIDKAPVEKISVVFASESLTQPASIMGHIFLKLSGYNNRKVKSDHTVSFFTRMDDVDPLTLIVQSFLTGKKGFYSLAPFSDAIDYYVKGEGRTLWEYELKLNNEQTKFLSYYLYEMRNIELKYFFHSFNCSTLINRIIVTVYSEMKSTGHLWITPLDVIKELYKNDLIAERQVYPSSSWLILRLRQLNGKSLVSKAEYISDSSSLEEKALNFHYLKAYQDYLFEREKIDRQRFNDNMDALKTKFSDNKKYDEISMEDLDGPEKTIQDSQILLSSSHYGMRDQYDLYFLPISHQIHNDLSGYTFESEVKLFGLNLTYSKENDLKVSEVDIFKVAAYNHHDPLIGGLSGQFFLSYQDNSNNLNLVDKKRLEAFISLGKTYRYFNDLDFYIWPALLISQSDTASIMLSPQTGIILREVFKMKTTAYYEHQFGTHNDSLDVFDIKQSFNSSEYSVGFSYSKYFNKKDTREKFGAFISHIF